MWQHAHNRAIHYLATANIEDAIKASQIWQKKPLDRSNKRGRQPSRPFSITLIMFVFFSTLSSITRLISAQHRSKPSKWWHHNLQMVTEQNLGYHQLNANPFGYYLQHTVRAREKENGRTSLTNQNSANRQGTAP